MPKKFNTKNAKRKKPRGEGPPGTINKAKVKSWLSLRQRSQIELAAYLDISPVYLSEILAQKKHGSGQYPAIAAFLAVPLEEILDAVPTPQKGG